MHLMIFNFNKRVNNKTDLSDIILTKSIIIYFTYFKKMFYFLFYLYTKIFVKLFFYVYLISLVLTFPLIKKIQLFVFIQPLFLLLF